MDNKQYLLSICIPSYNRFGKLKEHLQSIFRAQSKEFEVVIIDNGSTQDIKEELTFRHPRLRIIKREKSIDRQQSVLKSVTFANAKYALILLDKDTIVGKELDAFIDTIKGIPDLYGGYVRPHHNPNEASNRIKFYKHGRLKKFGYRGVHPSGIFVRTDCARKTWEHFTPEESIFCYCDLYLAEAALEGPLLEYDRPMIFFETLAESLKTKSYANSSGNSDAIWFAPQAQIRIFAIYCKHLMRLPCSKFTKYVVLSSLYRRTIIMITLNYRNSMNDGAFCAHYCVLPRKISFKEMCHGWKLLSQSFKVLNVMDHGIEKWIKYLIIWEVNISVAVGKWRRFL